MKQITFYLDFVSPYAWLAFERLPDALEGLSYSVAYRPVLLGALLVHPASQDAQLQSRSCTSLVCPGPCRCQCCHCRRRE